VRWGYQKDKKVQKEGEKVGIPRARCRTTLGMELRADSGWSGSALEKISVRAFQGAFERVGDKPRKVARIFAAFSASPGKLNPCAND
jgi:hypothetical protein